MDMLISLIQSFHSEYMHKITNHILCTHVIIICHSKNNKINKIIKMKKNDIYKTRKERKKKEGKRKKYKLKMKFMQIKKP
jgi:hypothetical protein